MGRTAHALSSGGQVWLIDPFDDEPALQAAATLGRPAGVLQLLDRHNRDCDSIAARLGVPLLRLPDRAPDAVRGCAAHFASGLEGGRPVVGR